LRSFQDIYNDVYGSLRLGNGMKKMQSCGEKVENQEQKENNEIKAMKDNTISQLKSR